MIYDPSIAYDYLQGSLTVVPFVDSNEGEQSPGRLRF